MSKLQKKLPLMFVGIDVAKEFFEICAIDSNGDNLAKFQITADKNGFIELINKLPSIHAPSFAMEDTGPYSGNLFQFLKQTNCQVICSNPFEISRLREVFSPAVKTDSVDAYVLAQTLRMGVLKDSQKEKKYIFLQDLLERQYDLTDRKTAVINQLRSALSQTFPEMEKVFDGIDCNASLAILSKYQTAKDLLLVDDESIRKLVRSNNGRMGRKKLTLLKELCKTRGIFQ